MKRVVEVIMWIALFLTILVAGCIDSDGFFFEKILAVLVIIDAITVYVYNQLDTTRKEC